MIYLLIGLGILLVTPFALALVGFITFALMNGEPTDVEDHNFTDCLRLGFVIFVWLAVLSLPAIYFVKVKHYSIGEALRTGIITSVVFLFGLMFSLSWGTLLWQALSEKWRKK